MLTHHRLKWAAVQRISCASALSIALLTLTLLTGGKRGFVRSTGVDAEPSESTQQVVATTVTDSYRCYVPIAFSDHRMPVWQLQGLEGDLITDIEVDPQEPNVLYAATTDQRGLFRSTDFGNTWHRIGNNLPENTRVIHVAVDALSSTQVYVTSPTHPRFYRSEDSGQTWQRGGDIPLIPKVLVVHPTITDRLFLGVGAWDVFGGGGWLLRSDDGGLNWTSVITEQVLANAVAASAVDPSLVYAGGNGLYHSGNGGEDFVRLSSGVPFSQVDAIAFHPTSPLTAYVSTETGSVYRTCDGGNGWLLWSDPLHVVQKLVVNDRSPEIQYMVADNCGGVFGSEDEGRNWQDLNNGFTDECVNDLEADGTFTRLYVATSNGIWSLDLRQGE